MRHTGMIRDQMVTWQGRLTPAFALAHDSVRPPQTSRQPARGRRHRGSVRPILLKSALGPHPEAEVPDIPLATRVIVRSSNRFRVRTRLCAHPLSVSLRAEAAAAETRTEAVQDDLSSDAVDGRSRRSES